MGIDGRAFTQLSESELGPYQKFVAFHVRMSLLECGHMWAVSDEGVPWVTLLGFEPTFMKRLAHEAGWRTNSRCMKPTCGKLFRRGKTAVERAFENERPDNRAAHNHKRKGSRRTFYDFKACPYCGEVERVVGFHEYPEKRNCARVEPVEGAGE